MLNFYSPFIQLVAAIYFSMCFEQLIEKFFWNKQHNEEMKKMTQKIKQNFGLTEKDDQEIAAVLNEKHIYFINKVKKWSILMFLLLITILFFSGVEQSFIICTSCYTKIIIVIISVLTLFPAICFFIQGWSRTQRYIKKINRVIDQEIGVFYNDMQASIESNDKNERYTKILAQIFKNIENGDIINKDSILVEIIQKFKADSVLKIKDAICEN